MKDINIKNEQYYVVHGWMITQLNLKGNPLIIYAIIFGFSQDGQSEFSGSLSYLRALAGGINEDTVRKAIKELEDKGYIKQSRILKNGIKCYKANFEGVEKLGGSPRKNRGEGVEKIGVPPRKNRPNNKRDNKIDNKVIYSAAAQKTGGLASEPSYDIEQFERQSAQPLVYVSQKERAAQS
ncbi:MAG: helix-turn-helix domain-containing protein [Clostridia bacterium]|nr:helix-turn-helix domain-containing protein [Clostridia bacterium]